MIARSTASRVHHPGGDDHVGPAKDFRIAFDAGRVQRQPAA